MIETDETSSSGAGAAAAVAAGGVIFFAPAGAAAALRGVQDPLAVHDGHPPGDDPGDPHVQSLPPRAHEAKGSSTRAAIVMLLGITFVIVIPAVILAILLVQQANVVVENLRSGDAQQMIQRIDMAQYLSLVQRVAPSFDPETLSPATASCCRPCSRCRAGWRATAGR